MGEIKSAWEIAMEKVEGLGKLPPEELRRQKEEEYALIGQVLADKYLGGLGFWQLEVELDKYGANERELVRSALISKLAQAIELGDHGRLEKAIEGISGLKQNKGMREIRDEIEQLFQEYEQEEEKESREIEKSARQMLHQLRISGIAVGAINPKVIPQWQQGLDTLARPYHEKLEQLKQKLIDLSGV